MTTGTGIPAPTPEIREHNLSNLAKAREALAAKRAAQKEQEAMTQAKKMQVQANAPFDNEKAQEIVSMYETVSLGIMQLIANKWVSLHDNYVAEAKTIFTPNAILESLGGGGQFKIIARDPENLGNILMGWTVGINKPPRPPARDPLIPAIPPPFGFDFAMPTGPAPMPPPQVQPTQLPTASTPQDPMQYPPQPPPGLPPQYRTLPVEQQWVYWQSMQASQQARGGIDAAGQVALSQVQSLLAEKGQLQAQIAAKDAALTATAKATDDKIERLEREFQRSLDEAKEARKKAEADATEARHRADTEAREARWRSESETREAAMRAELAKITARLENGGSEKKSDAKDGTLAIVAPLVLEWMRMNSSKDEGERNRALEQQKLLIATLQKKDGGLDDKLMGHVIELVKGKADEKVAATESQIMMLNALDTFIKSQQGEEPPLWLTIVEKIADGMKAGMFGAAVQGVQLPQAPQLTEGEEVPGTTSVVPDAQGLSVDERRAAIQWQKFQRVDMESAKMAFMAFQSPKMPPEFHTDEWRLLIFNLHHRKLSPEKLAELTVNHMEHLAEFGLMSPQFKPVFDLPRDMLTPVVMALPIAQIDKAYAEEFLNELVGEIEWRVEEKKRVEKEEAEEAAAEANGAAEVVAQ